MSDNVKITGLEVLDHKPNAHGAQLLATFCATVRGISIWDMRLVRTPRGGFKVHMPHSGKVDGRQAIKIADQSLDHELMDAARALYAQMGGQFGAYAGQQREAA